MLYGRFERERQHLQSQFDQIDFLQLKLKRFVGIVGSAEYERRLHETEEKELSRRIQENTCRLRETEELLNYAARNLDTCQPLSRRAARMSSLRERRGGRSANVRDSVRTRGVSGNMSRSEIANEENTGKRQSLRCRRRLRDDNAGESGLSCERDLRSRETLRDDNRLDSVLPSLQNMGRRQTLHRRLRDDNRRESALSNLPDLAHRQSVRCRVRDVDPAGSTLPNLQNLCRRESLLFRLRDGKPRQALLPNLRLGGRRPAVCDRLRVDERH